MVSSARPTGWAGARFWWAPVNAAGLRRATIFLPFVVAMAVAALPAGAGAAARLSATDKADVARVGDYLNTMTTLQARFLQVASSGAYAEGSIYISRPGKLRIEYDPPVPVLMVSAGSWLIYYDKELEQVSYLGIDSTPAGYFVSEKIDFGGDITVTRFERRHGVLRLSLVKTDEPLEGTITLVFRDRPLALKKWIVTDAQGVETTVSLVGVRSGHDLNPDLFRFADPRELKETDR